MALDRTHLLERERERQREEKERLEAEVTDLRLVLHGSRLAYRSPSMESLLATARKIARTDTTVLITGESGTGKEMLAHTVHELSGRRDKPVVVVDCGAIAPTLIEGKLFRAREGRVHGEPTPASPAACPRRRGRPCSWTRSASCPSTCRRSCSAVQEKQFTPVGSVVPRTVDVRIIAHHQRRPAGPGGRGPVPRGPVHRLNVVRLHVAPLQRSARTTSSTWRPSSCSSSPPSTGGRLTTSPSGRSGHSRPIRGRAACASCRT